MKSLSYDQKLAALVVPFILFGVLGTTYASAHKLELSEEQQKAVEVAKDLREEGDFEGAKEVLEDAGVFRGVGHMERKGGAMNETREAIKAAIETNDYNAFTLATENAPFVEEVNETMFAVLVEAHTLREAGDHEGAHALLEEAGLPGRGMHHRGRHRIESDESQ